MTTPPQALRRAQSTSPQGRSQAVIVGSIPVFDGTAAEAVAACVALARSGAGGRIATANLDFLALARKDAGLCRLLQDSSLVIADGMPVVWLGRLAGAARIERLAGADLVAELFAPRRGPALRIAIYGSTAETCAAALPVLEAKGDAARVVQVTNPPFRALTAAEREADRRAVAEAQPDVVLVALGCPAQERLMAEWAPSMPSVTWIGIGGTLDFYAGVRRRAPRAFQNVGLEWVVRMAQEPRRLGKRYLLRDIPALLAIVPGCLKAGLTARKRLHS